MSELYHRGNMTVLAPKHATAPCLYGCQDPVTCEWPHKDCQHCRNRRMTRLRSILNDMDVPQSRKAQVKWLGRNLAAKNGRHPDFHEAMDLLTKLS